MRWELKYNTPHAKCWAEWITSWNQDCCRKFQQPQVYRWYHSKWHIECSTLTASSFRIWNSSTGTPSSPLALFIVMLSKAHLTLHSTMSGSRWVITPSWLSGSWRSFLYSSPVYSCHFFLISSAFVRSTPFLYLIEQNLWSEMALLCTCSY